MPNSKHLPIPDTRECFLSHLGPWAIAPTTLQSLVSAWQSGRLEARTQAQKDEDKNSRYAPRVDNGIQIIEISGVMRPLDSKFGNSVSTTALRKVFRKAASDRAVDGVMLYSHTPGGSIAGMSEFMDDLQKLCAAKPVWTFVNELTASAGYWMASQTQRIIANKTAQIGSIGVIAMLVDDSKAMDKAGIKVIPITTGTLKAAGYPGVEISEEAIAEAQDIVNEYFEMFKTSVMDGREMSAEKFAKVSTGGVWTASKSTKLGLIDQVADFETAFFEFRTYLDKGEFELKPTQTPAAAAHSAFPAAPSAAAGVPFPNVPAAEKPLSDTATQNLPNKGVKPMSMQEVKAVAEKFKCLGAKGMEYLAQGIEFDAAATQELVAQAATITAQQAEINDLKQKLASEQAAHAAVTTELQALKSTAPQVPAGSTPADGQAKKPEEKDEKSDPVASFNAAVAEKVATGMKPADARAAVYKANPALTAAYEAAFPAPKA